MKDLNNISNVYFLGIGGIGMSALARYFHNKGIKVSGYDKTETPLTIELQREGIAVHYTDEIAKVDDKAQLVVYTPAIPEDHQELNYFQKNNYNTLKRSDVLGLITASTFNICVAGTHGKTTTSAMIAHILRDTAYGCNAFLGGVTVNYETNFWSSSNNVSVAEADEYDRSFLKLFPDVAVITSMDADHLDIYGTEENMQEAFIEFSSNIKKDGLLIKKRNISRTNDLKGDTQITYSLTDQQSDVFADNIKVINGSYTFDMMLKGEKKTGFQLNMGGLHNIENAIAAITVATYLAIDEDLVKKAVASFAGVKRRFEYIIKNSKRIFIDDYAHHPAELRALITSSKELFPGKKCVIVFQPHLYTRTRDLADDFAEILDMADEIMLLPIYPARELPIKGVNSQMILDRMKNPEKKIISKEELLQIISDTKPDFLITSGAGDIDTLVQPLKTILQN